MNAIVSRSSPFVAVALLACATAAGAASFRDAGGATHDLGDGRPSVLVFADSACKSCPAMAKSAGEAGAAARVLLLAAGVDPKALAQRFGIGYPAGVAAEDLRKACGFATAPMVCVLNGQGQLLDRYTVGAAALLARELATGGDVPIRALAANPLRHSGAPLRVVGLLREGKGGTIARGHFRLSNGIEVIGVRPWLPVKAARGQPSMNDFIEKPVRLTGQMLMTGRNPALQVTEAVILK